MAASNDTHCAAAEGQLQLMDIIIHSERICGIRLSLAHFCGQRKHLFLRQVQTGINGCRFYASPAFSHLCKGVFKKTINGKVRNTEGKGQWRGWKKGFEDKRTPNI